MSTQIRLFRPTYRIDECLSEIRECLEVGWTGIGFKTDQYEREFANYAGANYCYFTNSSTSGIHLLFEVLKREKKWESDDEVITSPITFVSANHAIVHAGLKPVFADVGIHLCLDADSVAQQITPRTRAVMYVSLGGNAAELIKIRGVCDKHGLTLIHDAAHSAGSRLNGAHLDKYADYSVYSFHAVKNLPTGDSGLIVLQTEQELALAKQLGWCGISKSTFERARTGYVWDYSVSEAGWKYHGNSLTAAIALVQLRYLESDNQRRRDVVAQYLAQLTDIHHVKPIVHVNEDQSSRHLFQVFAPQRDALMEFLRERDIGAGVHYRPNNQYPMYRYGKTPVAEKLWQDVVSLPLSLDMSDADVTKICESISQYYDTYDVLKKC
jgi:dTDP-4-amino-4,6-dideoxygalactose transaminase